MGLYYSAPEIPEQQTYGESMREGLQAQVDLAPDILASERQYGPQFQQHEIDMLKSSLFDEGGMLDVYGGAGSGERAREMGLGAYAREMAAGDKEAQVAADMGLFEQYAPMVRDVGRDPLSKALNESAMAGLETASQVSPEAQRKMEQQVLAMQEASGRMYDPVTMEKLFRGTEGVQMAREDRARNFAGAVAGINQAEDPFMAIFGRPGKANQMMGQQMGFASAQDPGNVFNPAAGAEFSQANEANRFSLMGALESAKAQANAGMWSGIGNGVGAFKRMKA